MPGLAALPLAASGCRHLDAIPFTPLTTPEQWCASRPCIDLGGVIWNEPLGTFLVDLLAAASMWVGWRIWRSRGSEKSRFWWALAMGLGGVAAGVAGTSYQAFSYELKCAERAFCAWTSWWEVAYLTIQNASIDGMVIAVAHSSTRGAFRRGLIRYAWANALLHLAVTAYGAIGASPLLISFELLLAFSLPGLAIGLGLNATRFWRHRTALDRALLGAWLWLVATNALYYGYLVAGYTQALWQDGRGFYFSENDVLHVGMIGWAVYVLLVVAPHVKDLADDTGAATQVRAGREPAAEVARLVV